MKKKFRAWDKSRKEYLSGGCLLIEVLRYKTPADPAIHLDQVGFPAGERFDIEQFTGLTDMNAKEIFEGDILNHDGMMLEIKYSDNHAKFNAGRDTLTKAYGIYSFVAGNIHENPELICLGCQNNHGGPSHKGSKRCESGSIASGGKNAHCTCDVCF